MMECVVVYFLKRRWRGVLFYRRRIGGNGHGICI
jgi:hypothetical protein